MGRVYMYSVKINPNVTTRIHPDGREIVYFKNSILVMQMVEGVTV